jgi:RNA polymerase sigma-54 factor
MLRQNLSQKLLQKLSPQQIQLMKLLQIPTATLEQRIKEELEANPALDEGDDFDDMELNPRDEDDLYDDNFGDASSDNELADDFEYNDDYIEEPLYKTDDINIEDYLGETMEDDIASYKLNANNHSADDEDKTIPIAVESTLQEHLERQIGLKNLTDHQTEIALQIIGNIDDDGYLRREPVAMVDDLAFSQNVLATEEEIKEVIKIVQKFTPSGICSTSLEECLLIQLRNKLEDEIIFYEEGTLDRVNLLNAIIIIEKYFNEFSKKHYDKLKKQLDLSDAQLKATIDEILKLNPKPASSFTTSTRMIQYIVPDFMISYEDDGELKLTLNARNAPELRINEGYKDMLVSYDKSKKQRKPNREEKDAVVFIKQKIDSAKWFIDAIKQRQQTMSKTMYSIMNYQYDYFKTGDERLLRPMILKDIAEITGLDISTVSRVANSKYVQTEFGTKRLKDFFSESLQTDTGEEVSTLEVKKILKDLISNESKSKPLSDEKLKNDLRDKGYNIARRTVAKYREQLGIPVARLRKEL